MCIRIAIEAFLSASCGVLGWHGNQWPPHVAHAKSVFRTLLQMESKAFMNYTRHFQCSHIYARLLVLLESIAGVPMAMLCGEATVRSTTPTGNLARSP